MTRAVINCHKCNAKLSVALRPVENVTKRLFGTAARTGWKYYRGGDYCLCAACVAAEWQVNGKHRTPRFGAVGSARRSDHA